MNQNNELQKEKFVEFEAETLTEARLQVPEGLYLSEEIVSDGKPKTVTAYAVTTAAAYAQGIKKIPVDAKILEQKELASPSQKSIQVQAFDDLAAESKAKQKLSRKAVITAITLSVSGNKGFIGIGKTPHQYEVDILQMAEIEIVYKDKAKIRGNLFTAEELVASLVDSLWRKYMAAWTNKVQREGFFSNAGIGTDWIDNELEVFERMGEVAVEPLLIASKKTSFFGYDLIAVMGLGATKSKRATVYLIEALNNHNSDIRCMAAMSLSKIKDERAVDPLAHLLDDEKDVVKWTAIDALGAIGRDRAKTILVKALHEEQDQDLSNKIRETLDRNW